MNINISSALTLSLLELFSSDSSFVTTNEFSNSFLSKLSPNDANSDIKTSINEIK